MRTRSLFSFSFHLLPGQHDIPDAIPGLGFGSLSDVSVLFTEKVFVARNLKLLGACIEKF